MGAGRQFTSNARWAMLAKMISVGVSIPFFLLMPKWLGGKDIYGQFALAISISVVLRMLAGGGLGYSTGRRLAESKAEGGDGSHFMAAGLTLQLLLAAIVGAGFFAASRPLSTLFAQKNDPTLALIFAAVGVSVFFFAILEFAKAAFQGAQRFQYLALVTGIEFSGKLLIGGGLALAGYGVVAAFGGYSIALAMAATVALLLVWRIGLSRPESWLPHWRDLYLYNVPLMLTATGFIIYTELDTQMLYRMSGPGQTGVYAAAMSITRAAPLFAMPFGQAAAPVVVKLVREQSDKAAEFVGRLLKYVAAVFIPAGVLVAVTAPHLVKIWGSDFAGAAAPLRVMSVFIISSSIGAAISPIIDYLGESAHRALWMTVSVAANVVLNFLLIPRFGGVGAALATAVTHGPFMLNNLIFLAGKVNLSKRRMGLDLGRILAAAGAAGAAGVLALAWRDNFFIAVTVGAAVYLGLIFLLGVFSRDELAEVARMIRTTGLPNRPEEGELVSDGAEG